ncbi:MAG: Asp-tRNA(Asn)/Glu-tRNA(Gln) amidotransferase GatCAB subunit A, partial [Mycoplasma sp.]|nr:Asp-tRNA(Asn)/Glu-tRNA(Gln) amidotransferase GatCAB subunit A [Mycoplasma sp.]
MNKTKYNNFFNLFKNKNNLIAAWNKETNNKPLATIKDNIATKFLPTMGSSLLLKDFYPFYNATVIDKLIKNNVDIIAKTHLDEFGMGGTGLFSGYGFIYNPLDQKRIIGGSSSGSAATFTNDIYLSIASDTGNSIRVPASYIGIYGFKPSYGAISRYGLYSYSSSLDTIGFYVHNVKETIEISNIIFDKDQKDMTSQAIEKPNFDIKKPKSIAYYDVLELYPNYIQKAFFNLIDQLKNQNIQVNPIKIDISLFKHILLTYQIISYVEALSNLSRYSGLVYGNSIEKDNWLDTLIETRSKYLGFMVQKRLTIISIILNDQTFDY